AAHRCRRPRRPRVHPLAGGAALMRIFISYARRDGGDLALRLQRDLESRGYDAWLDQTRLHAGDRWTREVEAALDRAQVVLALLSAGSFDSDTCRAEQGWALEAGKRVIPIKVYRDAKPQLQLHGLHWLDFSDPTKYAERLEQLVGQADSRSYRQ